MQEAGCSSEQFRKMAGFCEKRWRGQLYAVPQDCRKSNVTLDTSNRCSIAGAVGRRTYSGPVKGVVEDPVWDDAVVVGGGRSLAR